MTEPSWLVTFPYRYLLKPLDVVTAHDKLRQGLCWATGCRRKKAHRKNVCTTCHSRIQRIRNPLTYVYNTVRNSAKRRHITFELSREEFRLFCERTGYLNRRGQAPGAMSIDRIDHSRGYAADNIQLTEWLDNSTKGKTSHPSEPVIDEEAPFGW